MGIFRRSRPEPSVRVRELRAARPNVERRTLVWPLAAALSALLTAATGWLLMASICFMGWVILPEIPIGSALQLATRVWLLAHGVPAELPGSQLSIIPLGVTLLIGCWVLIACRWATTLARFTARRSVGQRLAVLSATYLTVYAIILVAATAWTSPQSGNQLAVLRAVFVIAVASVIGFARALHWSIRRNLPHWPEWVQALPSAIGVGLAVMIVIGALVLALSLIANMGRVTLIHDSLQPGVLGSIMLLLGQLAWLPNLILWAAAWASGAGLSLGVETVVSPVQSQVGMLPAIPVFGAVPSAGTLPTPMVLWLASSFLAGGLAAYVLVHRYIAVSGEGGAPVENTTVIGALAAIATGFCFALLELLATGDLGATRLIGLGARFPAVLIMVPTSMGMAGLLVGCLFGFRARPKQQAKNKQQAKAKPIPMQQAEMASEPGPADAAGD